jgi:hypothetical protein
VALGAVLLISVLLRVGGLDWGIRSLEDFRLDGRALKVTEAGFHADTDALYAAAESLSDSAYPLHNYASQDYHFTSYGTLFLYLNRLTASAGSLVFDFDAFGSGVNDVNYTRIAGRWGSVLASVATVWVGWLVGASLFGPIGGLGCALLVGVLPMSVQAAHMATADGLLALWFSASIGSMIRIVSRSRMQDYVLAGVFVGLATATKVNGLFLLLPLGLAHLLSQREGFTPEAFYQAATSRQLYAAAATALIVWAVLTPAAIFEPGAYFAPDFAGPYHLQFSLRKASEGAASHRGWLHMDGVSTYFYHPLHVFPSGLGWSVQLAALGGMILLIRKRRTELVIIAVSVIGYYLLVARLPDKPIRFFVPLSLFVACLAVYPLSQIVKSKRFRLAVFALAALLFIEPAFRSAALASVYRQPDSRVLAAEWIQKQVPFGGKLMLERGHNSLRPLVSGKRISMLTADLGQEFANARNTRLAEEGHYSAILEAEFLSQVDYLAISDEGLAARRVRAAVEDYYARLFAGELGFTLDRTFSGEPRLFGISLEGKSPDLNWTRYDHPTTYVFRRTGEPTLYEKHPELRLYQLRSWQAVRELIKRSQKEQDILLFKRCLPAAFKERVGERAIASRFLRFLKEPQSLIGESGQLKAIREGNTWRVKPDPTKQKH